MRIPLGQTDAYRSIAETPPITVYNRFFESDPTNQTDQVALLARPALRKWLTLDTSAPRAVYAQPGTFAEALFVVAGDTLYRIDQDETITTVGTLGGQTGFVSMAATDTYLFIADGSGLWYYTDDGYATGTLTASGAISAGDKVVIGSVTYEFTSGSVDTGAPDGEASFPWLIALGGSSAQALQHLYDAIGNTGIAGTDYSTLLTANVDAAAMSVDATTLKIRAAFNGTGGNSVATTETGANLAWGGSVLSGGGGTDFAQITVPDAVGIISVGVIAGFTICVTTQGFGVNGRFYWIEPGEITIDALNFATAERSPDPVWNVVVVGDQFWLPGSSTTEVWYPSGDSLAPFQRQPGRLFDKGVWEGTVLQVKDSVMAVGTDGTVYRIDAEPVVISTPGISQRLREAINAQRAAVNAGTVPLVTTDFKNGVYTINGVSKTLAEVVEQNATYGAYSSADVVAGTGLTISGSGTAPFAAISGPVLTAAAFAAATPAGVNAGLTMVATLSVSQTVDAVAFVALELAVPDTSTGWGGEIGWSSTGNDSFLYDYGAINDIVTVAAPGTHKIALTLSASHLAISVDGGNAVVSAAPQSNPATIIGLFAKASASTGSGTATATIERADFYATAADADLPGLSA